MTNRKTTPQARYDATHTRQIKFKFNINTDADILQFLDRLENKQGFIKELIRKEIKKNI